jgi:2',3'-cyclic-nucleotide 2'-phosphodiesterase (5'-nucleotidase family)
MAKKNLKTKKFTILHSNDMHGDFLAEIKEGK